MIFWLSAFACLWQIPTRVAGPIVGGILAICVIAPLIAIVGGLIYAPFFIAGHLANGTGQGIPLMHVVRDRDLSILCCSYMPDHLDYSAAGVAKVGDNNLVFGAYVTNPTPFPARDITFKCTVASGFSGSYTETRIFNVGGVASGNTEYLSSEPQNMGAWLGGKITQQRCWLDSASY